MRRSARRRLLEYTAGTLLFVMAAAGTHVLVAQGAQATGSESGKFSVIVRDDSGAFVDNAMVWLSSPPASEKHALTHTGLQGKAILHVPPGAYRICAKAHGFAESCVPTEVSASTASYEIRLGVAPTSTSLTVTSTPGEGDGVAALSEAAAGLLETRDVLLLPFAVHAFPAAGAQERGAQTVGEALQPDSSLLLTTGSQRNSPFYEQIYSRGLAVNNYTGVAVDGLFGLAGTLPITDAIETIEHIDGPATFLSGTPGNVGGVINLLPKRAEERRFSISPEYMSRGVGGGRGDGALRFGPNEMLGARGITMYRAGRTEIEDNHLWQTASALDLDVRSKRASGSLDLEQDRTLNRGYSLFATFANGTPVTAAPSGHLATQLPWMEAWDRDLRVIGRGEVHLSPNWEVIAGAGHTDVRFEYGGYCQATILSRDGMTSCLPIQAENVAHITSVNAGSRWHMRTGPVQHEIYAGYDRLAYPTDTYGTLVLASAPLFFNMYSAARPATSMLRASRPALYRTSEQSTQSGVVADTLTMFRQRLQVTAGVRYVSLSASSYAPTGTVASHTDSSAGTPSIGAVWRLVPWLSLYGNYIEALEPAAMPPATAKNAGSIFQPLRSRQLEAGLKFRRRAWAGEVAAFRIQRANQYLDPVTNLFTQNGMQRNAGVDGSLSWQRANGGFVQVSASGLSAILQRTAGAAFDGKHAPAVPSYTIRSNTAYPVPGTHKSLRLGASANINGSAPFENSNARTVPGWFDLSPMAMWTSRNEQDLQVRFKVGNATAQRYWIGAGNGLVSIGEARFYQVSVSKSIH